MTPLKDKIMTNFINHRKLTRVSQLAAVLVISIALASCASTPMPPTQELQAAQLSITNAEQNGVADYASAELNQAREKLAAANSAVTAKNMVLATYLATESRASADLAAARTEMLKAQVVNDEMQKSINTLNVELQRNSGVQR